jgi:hypothetical protein
VRQERRPALSLLVVTLAGGRPEFAGERLRGKLAGIRRLSRNDARFTPFS